MTSLPITASTLQATATPSQASAPPETGGSQSSQPFGEVLARQINDPAANDVKSSDKSGAESLLLQGTLGNSGSGKKKSPDITNDAADARKTTPVHVPDNTTALPTDMLAALMPQTMSNAAATSSKTESPAGAAQAKPGIAALSGNITANVRTDAANAANVPNAANTAAGAGRAPQNTGQTFSAVLGESSGRTSAVTEPNATAPAANTDPAPKSDAAAIASLQNTVASFAAPVIQPVQITVNTPVAQNKWGDEFSQKITWLASSGKDQTAELHLNPPQLGPLDVVLKVSGDQATALFTSPHAAVRDAVEQAMPKLREMLAGNGITLGNTTVSDQTPRDQGQSGTQRSHASPINDVGNIPAGTGNSAVRVSPISRHNGIVDTFA